MGIALSILKALTAAWNVWKQEREIFNRPDMVKQKAAENIQLAQDRLSIAEATLADPRSTRAQHAEALRQVRLAHS